LVCHAANGSQEIVQTFFNLLAPAAKKQAEVGRHLVISAPARMKLQRQPAYPLLQLLLDVGVDIFSFALDDEPRILPVRNENASQAPFHSLPLSRRKDASALQGARVGKISLNVGFQQDVIEGK